MAAVAIPEETLETYIRSEFRAMDTDRDGKLNRQQVLDLITLLGCSKGKDALRVNGNAMVGIGDGEGRGGG